MPHVSVPRQGPLGKGSVVAAWEHEALRCVFSALLSSLSQLSCILLLPLLFFLEEGTKGTKASSPSRFSGRARTRLWTPALEQDVEEWGRGGTLVTRSPQRKAPLHPDQATLVSSQAGWKQQEQGEGTWGFLHTWISLDSHSWDSGLAHFLSRQPVAENL